MKLTLLNSNTTLNVVQFKSTAIQFNTDFSVDIHATTPELLGDLSSIFLTLNTDEGTEILRGIITEFTFYVSHLHGYCYHFVAQSLLFPFSLNLHTRFYRNMTAEDILRKVLVSTKFDLSFDLKNALPVLPQIIQYKETDCTFIERFMAYYGLLGKFEVNEKTCVYRIADRLSAFDIGACPNFPYAPNSKRHEAPVMLAYHQTAQLQPQHFIFTEFDVGNPNQSFRLETSSNNLIPGQGETRLHGLGRFETDIRNQLAQNWQIALDASRTMLTITIDDPCVLLGNTLTLSGSEAWEGTSKKYRIIEQTHIYDTEGYRQICRLHPVSEPYYKMPLSSTLPAGILTARVQSNSDDTNPYDEAGRYNLKFDLDENESTSILTHAMQPSTGSMGGFHFPYQTNTNVLVQSFGKDALDPIILGAMHLDDQPSLVSSINAGQHILTSKGNQTLLMDDDNSVFTINDLASNLSMNASENPNVNLSTDGLMNLSANTGLLENVQENSNYIVRKDHTQTVKDNVNKVSYHHQEVSGQDISKKMGVMELRSEKDLNLKAEQDFMFSAQTARLEGAELLFFTEQGDMSFNLGNGLNLSSGKGFNIAQTGASFVMDDLGNMQVIGKNNITLNFSDASLQGQKINLGGNSILNSKLPLKPKLIYPYLIAQNPLTWDESPSANEVSSLPFVPKASDPADTAYFVQTSGAEMIEVNDKKLPFPTNQLNTKSNDYQQATSQHSPVPASNLVLKAKQLFPPVILDWNDPKKTASTKPLSDDQIKYFKNHGSNAFIFVHGYNVPSGAFGQQITDIQFSPTPPLAEGIEMGAAGFVRATTINAPQTIARTQTQLAKLYPEFAQALKVNAVLPDSLEETGTLNGTGGHNWLVHIEDDLNRATGQFDGSDYTKYQRIIGVFWHGAVGPDPFDYVAFPASEQEADNSTLILNFYYLLLQLHNAGISINIMAHSLGNRVVLNVLNLLGNKGYTSIVEHFFMWEAAVANNALSTKEGAPYSKAAATTNKITVLYSQNDDFVLDFAYSEDKVLGEEVVQGALNTNQFQASPVKAVSAPPPALGYAGPDQETITELGSQLTRANLTPWTKGLPGHSYMLIPNDNIMKHGYQTFIINKTQGVTSFGKYNRSAFPNYSVATTQASSQTQGD